MTFRTIVLDPPWAETGGVAKSKAFGAGARGADQHYPVLKTPDILDVVQAMPEFVMADNAHMWMWTTKTFVPDALWLMDKLGFRYVTMLVWVKTDNRIGMGKYFRGKMEPLLFGVKGKGLDPSVCTSRKAMDDLILGPEDIEPGALDIEGMHPSDLILAPRTYHSRKPVEAVEKIEGRSHGPYLEVFGRGTNGREGWTIVGNQAISKSDLED